MRPVVRSQCAVGEPHWRCTYLGEGEAFVHVDNTEVQLGPGQILITDRAHTIRASSGEITPGSFCDPTWEVTRLTLKQLLATPVATAGATVLTGLPICAPRQPHIQPILKRLQTEAGGQDRNRCVWCRALSHQLLREVLISFHANTRHYERPTKTSRDVVALVSAELVSRSDHPWTMDEMSRRAGYSARQLTRMFTQVTALSPHQWLLEARIRLAQSRLTESDDRITDIALDVGFAGRRQFRRAFELVVGLTPTQYRALARGRGQWPDSSPCWPDSSPLWPE